MKNQLFEIEFDKEKGFVTSIVHREDSVKMNWCSNLGGFGEVISSSNETLEGENREMSLVSFEEYENCAKATFSNGIIAAQVKHTFAENGNFKQSFKIRNLLDVDVFLEHGNLGFSIPFNDIYTYADDCMTNRCNTHIWCGYDVAYVNALKMGQSEINLGLVLTKGSLRSYSVDNCKSNQRGRFILNSDHIELTPEGEYTLEWEMFFHTGKEDFYKKLEGYDCFVDVRSEHFTVFCGEDIKFDFSIPKKEGNVRVMLGGKSVPVSLSNGRGYVSFSPDGLGEYRFDIYVGNIHTYTEFYVSQRFDKLVENRVNYIVDNQQVTNPESRLYGAYVIYDIEEGYKVFNHTLSCHNACKERLGMALFVSEYLLRNPENKKIRDSFMLFVEFMLREFVDVETGHVYGSIGMSEEYIRLYNAPWVATLLNQIYLITNEEKYLDYLVRVLDKYYNQFNGYNFYPNGFLIQRIVETFGKAGNKANETYVRNCFTNHVESMISKGTSYPKHEVNYEQTIVSPAASFISEMGMLTGKAKYTTEAKKQIVCLERFNGNQPSYHLYEIPIRFWDSFWGGKCRIFGDNYPQYWSCLTARSYKNYYLISGEEEYLYMAEECMRNTLCLFRADGTASCAYVYPFKCNGVRGQLYDGWANDQDYALFFALVNKFFD